MRITGTQNGLFNLVDVGYDVVHACNITPPNQAVTVGKNTCHPHCAVDYTVNKHGHGQLTSHMTESW